MKRIKKILVTLTAAGLMLALAPAAIASADNAGPLGPNPLAGDGIPDGSSLDSPNGPNHAPSFQLMASD